MRDLLESMWLFACLCLVITVLAVLYPTFGQGFTVVCVWSFLFELIVKRARAEGKRRVEEANRDSGTQVR